MAPSVARPCSATFGKWRRLSRVRAHHDAGSVHHVRQAEGIEQGDPLAPAFFAPGQHDSLATAHARLQPGEVLAAFLDDLYVVTCPARAREACDIVSREVEQGAGVSANLGKTRAFHAGGCRR